MAMLNNQRVQYLKQWDWKMAILFEGFHLTCWHVSLGNRSLVEVSSEGFCARDFAVLSWIRAKTRTGTSHCKNFILFVVIVMVLSYNIYNIYNIYIYIVTINHQHHFHHGHHAINSLVKNLSHKWDRRFEKSLTIPGMILQVPARDQASNWSCLPWFFISQPSFINDISISIPSASKNPIEVSVFILVYPSVVCLDLFQTIPEPQRGTGHQGHLETGEQLHQLSNAWARRSTFSWDPFPMEAWAGPVGQVSNKSREQPSRENVEKCWKVGTSNMVRSFWLGQAMI